MARQESDREDLIREATALKQRVEWTVPGEPGPVVAGCRRDGSLSVFFDQDPVYQFTPHGQLRRAFVDGFLFRTQGSTLARLTRKRTETETTLVRYDLTKNELSEFHSTMRQRLTQLREQLVSGAVQVEREVTDGTAPDYSAALQTVLETDEWLAPAFPGRRA